MMRSKYILLKSHKLSYSICWLGENKQEKLLWCLFAEICVPMSFMLIVDYGYPPKFYDQEITCYVHHFDRNVALLP